MSVVEASCVGAGVTVTVSVMVTMTNSDVGKKLSEIGGSWRAT